MRGYVYLGGQLIALQYGGVYWVHQEPYTKGQRFTNSAGAVTGNIVEVDPWGGNTARSANSSFQPHLFTSYERDSDGGDEAMNRRYSPYWSRFSQPDPYDGSYDSANPQSFNRYSYVNNDPVNFDDPSGLTMALTCLVDGIPSSSCTAALGLVSSGAGVIYGGTGWYGEGDIFVIDHLNMIDSSSHLNTWQTIFFMDLQNSGFTNTEKGILDTAINRIKQKDCVDWFNKKLKDLGASKDKTFDNLLGQASFRKYDENATAAQLGVSYDALLSLWDTFHNHDDKPAQTIGNQIFMGDLAFKRNSIWIPGTDNRDIDTATIVAHELFHVAGFKDDVVQGMNREIHDNCGFTGMNY